MRSHLLALVAFSAVVSAVFAMLMRDDAPRRARFGARVFTAFVLSALLLGWLMAPFPG